MSLASNPIISFVFDRRSMKSCTWTMRTTTSERPWPL